MAELVLTPEEKAAASYLEWDDAALGRFTKYVAQVLQNLESRDGHEKATVASIAIMLIGAAHQANAAGLVLTYMGHTHDDVPTGDWQIAVRRIAPPPRAN